MMIFHKNLRKFAEIIKISVAKILKICLKKMYTLNRYGGNSRFAKLRGDAAGPRGARRRGRGGAARAAATGGVGCGGRGEKGGARRGGPQIRLDRAACQASDGSFSAVWTATIASKDAFFCIFRDLQDLHSFAPLRSKKKFSEKTFKKVSNLLRT